MLTLALAVAIVIQPHTYQSDVVDYHAEPAYLVVEGSPPASAVPVSADALAEPVKPVLIVGRDYFVMPVQLDPEPNPVAPEPPPPVVMPKLEPAGPQPQTSVTVLFEYNSSLLPESERAKLHGTPRNAQAMITGYTSQGRNIKRNQQLAFERARAVEQALRSMGFTGSVTTEAKANCCFVPSIDVASAKNQRATVVFTLPSPPPSEVK